MTLKSITHAQTAKELRHEIPTQQPKTDEELLLRVICVRALELLEISEQRFVALSNERAPAAEVVNSGVSDDFIRKSFLIEGERNALIEVVKLLTGGKIESGVATSTSLSTND